MKQYKDRLGSITSLQSRETNKDNKKNCKLNLMLIIKSKVFEK